MNKEDKCKDVENVIIEQSINGKQLIEKKENDNGDSILNLNVDTDTVIKNGLKFTENPLEWICGIVIAIFTSSILIVFEHLGYDWKLCGIISLTTFVFLITIAVLLYFYKKKEKEIKKEELYIDTVINDFKQKKYYKVSLKYENGCIEVKQKDGYWELTYFNRITNSLTQLYE